MPTAAPPAASNEPSPPLDPPAVLDRFQGLFVLPYNLVSVSWQKQRTGVFVFPRKIAPSFFNLLTTSASSLAVAFLRWGIPAVVAIPLMSKESVIVIEIVRAHV